MSSLVRQLMQLDEMSTRIDDEAQRIPRVIARGAPAACEPLSAEQALEEALRSQAGRYHASAAASMEGRPDPLVQMYEPSGYQSGASRNSSQPVVDVIHRDIV